MANDIHFLTILFVPCCVNYLVYFHIVTLCLSEVKEQR